MNDRQSERKSPDSLSLSIRVALYLNRESETACNPLISSWASTCFKLTGAQGRSSFIAADTPNPSERHSSQCQRTSNALKHQSSIFFSNYTCIPGIQSTLPWEHTQSQLTQTKVNDLVSVCIIVVIVQVHLSFRISCIIYQQDCIWNSNI
jgi:hypothetical protein